MLMLAMKSAGPKMIVSMRSLATAMSLTLIRPCAVSICASMPIRPTSRPLAFSIWVSSRSSAFTWAASWTFGSMMQSRLAPAPPTTSSTSWKVHSVVQSLTRTVRILSPQPPSFRAATMFLRAPGLASGAHASSRSRKTWSAGRPLAFSRKRGLLPGTARLERRGRRSATVPPLRWGSLLLPEGSDGRSRSRPGVSNPSGHQVGGHLVDPVDRQPGIGGVPLEDVGVRRLVDAEGLDALRRAHHVGVLPGDLRVALLADLRGAFGGGVELLRGDGAQRAFDEVPRHAGSVA